MFWRLMTIMQACMCGVSRRVSEASNKERRATCMAGNPIRPQPSGLFRLSLSFAAGRQTWRYVEIVSRLP